MIDLNIQTRFNGRVIEAQAPIAVRVQTPEVASNRVMPTALIEDMRAQFDRLRDPSALEAVRKFVGGRVLKAGMYVPGEDPILVGNYSSSIDGDHHMEVGIGCGIKLVTSSALHDHIESGRCSLQATVSEILDMPCLQGRSTSSIQIEQLLNHRHGLDDDGLTSRAFMSDGRIDEAKLVSTLNQRTPRFPPDWQYSYSKAGYWLIGAVLQRLEDRSFADVLAARNVQAIGNVCPAMGGDCWMSGEQLLKFLVERLEHGRGTRFPPACPSESNLVPIPGWHPFERGMQLGWKVFANGWVGHSALRATARGLMRVHPMAGTALFLWCDARLVTPIAMHIFGRILPESNGLRLPRRLTLDEWKSNIHERYCGSFGTPTLSLRIKEVDANGLIAVREGRSSPGRVEHLRFVPAENGTFFSMPARMLLFPYIQFLFSANGVPEAVWDGTRMWPRIDAAST